MAMNAQYEAIKGETTFERSQRKMVLSTGDNMWIAIDPSARATRSFVEFSAGASRTALINCRL